MFDLFSVVTSICCVSLWYCLLVIRQRLQQVDGKLSSPFIFNQARLYRRYWKLARDHSWSRTPVLLGCLFLFCGLLSSTAMAVYVLSHWAK